MKTLLFSIVITTKNEEKNIENCLLSIKHQDFPKNLFEIIVVDNDSKDRTKEIAKKNTNKVHNFGPERSAQRNFGMLEKARGEYVMYLDADMILSKNILKKAKEVFKKKKTVALYVAEIVLGDSFWCRVRRFERSFYDGTPIDCVRMIKRDVFKKVGGFDLSLTGPEDWDLDKKIRDYGKVEVLDTYNLKKINDNLNGINICEDDWVETLSRKTEKAVIFHNESSFNLGKYLEKKKYYSKSFKNYIDKWGKNDDDVKKQFSFFYRFFGVFIEKKKYLKLASSPILTFGMLYLRFLVGLNYFLLKVK